MSVINTANLGALCDEYLARMAKGELSAEEQKDAASILDDRIRRLANTCKAGFDGKLLGGKWHRADEEFDSYDDVKRSER